MIRKELAQEFELCIGIGGSGIGGRLESLQLQRFHLAIQGTGQVEKGTL
jgi:hypothetical protein